MYYKIIESTNFRSRIFFKSSRNGKIQILPLRLDLRQNSKKKLILPLRLDLKKIRDRKFVDSIIL